MKFKNFEFDISNSSVTYIPMGDMPKMNNEDFVSFMSYIRTSFPYILSIVLDNNDIESLEGVTKNYNLINGLSLKRNKLKNLKGLSSLVENVGGYLFNLDLEGNEIEDLCIEGNKLLNIDNLNLTDNKLKTLKGIEGIRITASLNLFNNPIEDFSSINCRSLLSLRNLNISTSDNIDFSSKYIPHYLKFLTLKNFKITEEILKLSSLKFLELINCDFSGNLTPKETVSDAPLISCLETLYIIDSKFISLEELMQLYFVSALKLINPTVEEEITSKNLSNILDTFKSLNYLAIEGKKIPYPKEAFLDSVDTFIFNRHKLRKVFEYPY